MSRHIGRFVTLVAALFTISTAIADRSVNPSPMLDLVDAFNLTAIDLNDLDLEALFPDGLPAQEPPVNPGHPNELYRVLPPVVNQLPVQTPLILTLRVTTEKSYTTEIAENQPPGSSSTTEKHTVDDSTNQPSYESDVAVLGTEGLDYETTKYEARETVVDELRAPTVQEESMPPTPRQEPATPTQYEVKSTTQYETTLYDTQPQIVYETNPPVRHETNRPLSYETNSPTRHEPSPHSLSTQFQTSSVFKRQTTDALHAYPTTTALFVRMKDPREPTAYTPRDTYSTSLGYDVAHVSLIPTKTQTRASPHPTRSTKKVSSKQTKPILSSFASTIRSFTKAKRPHFGEKLGHGEIRVKGAWDTPQRKGNVPSGHSKLTYDDINRRKNTKRQISKQTTVKWVNIPSARPLSTTPSKHYISEYKPIQIMPHHNPYKIRNQSTPLARTTTKVAVAMKETPDATVLAPYNSHSNPKLQTTTPSYDVSTGRSPSTLHSKPSFEISMKVQQQMNPELMSHLFEEKPAVDYLESQPTATTHTYEDQTTRKEIYTYPTAQTTTFKEEAAYLRPTTKLPHPSGSADKKRVPLRRRPDGSYRPLVPATKEPSYYRPSTVKAVEHLSSTEQPTWYRPQKLKHSVNLPVVSGVSATKNYATSYVISNKVFRI